MIEGWFFYNGRGIEQLGTSWMRTHHPLPSFQAKATHAQPLKPQLLMNPCCALLLFY